MGHAAEPDEVLELPAMNWGPLSLMIRGRACGYPSPRALQDAPTSSSVIRSRASKCTMTRLAPSRMEPDSRRCRPDSVRNVDVPSARADAEVAQIRSPFAPALYHRSKRPADDNTR